MAMYAAGIGALCISSSVAAVMMNKKEDEVAVPAEQPEETVEKVEVEETGLAPEQPPPPPSEPAQTQLTTPDSMRSASMVHGNRGLNWKLQRCGDSMIDSSGGWCGKNTVGNWIQLDNGKVGSISAIVTQGRKDAAQWVKSFKVKYKDGSGSWWDIDGKTFPGNVDKSSKVITTFSKPVRARYIRIYPQTWNGHMSMRADMIAGDTNTNQSPSVGDLPYSGHSSSGNWANKPINGSCGKGRLDSTQGWCAKKNTVGEWYQLGLTSPVNVSGMVMKGRHDANQWVTSTKFQYENEDGEFVDVDGGFIFDANYDRHSLMKIFFEKPVRTKAIRIYPQTWKGHMSGRFGILRGGSSSEGYRSRPVEKEIEAFSFY
jgi:hypothetical protein